MAPSKQAVFDTFESRVYDAFKELEKAERPRRISQGQLAERVQALTGGTVRQERAGKWLRGAARPEYEELPALAHVLGVRLLWLAFGFGEMRAAKPEHYPLAIRLPSRVRQRIKDPDLPDTKQKGKGA